MTNPDCLIMDEPSEGLAPIIIQGVWEAIGEAEGGRPVDPAGRAERRARAEARGPRPRDEQGPGGLFRPRGAVGERGRQVELSRHLKNGKEKWGQTPFFSSGRSTSQARRPFEIHGAYRPLSPARLPFARGSAWPQSRPLLFRRHRLRHLSSFLTLGEFSSRFGCSVHAYCLMTNHVHLLVTPHSADACSLLMKNLGQCYVQGVNHRLDRTGTLWEGRFHSCLVNSDHYVLACYRYIRARIRFVPAWWTAPSSTRGRAIAPTHRAEATPF